jgi:hypothetical protein
MTFSSKESAIDFALASGNDLATVKGNNLQTEISEMILNSTPDDINYNTKIHNYMVEYISSYSNTYYLIRMSYDDLNLSSQFRFVSFIKGFRLTVLAENGRLGF